MPKSSILPLLLAALAAGAPRGKQFTPESYERVKKEAKKTNRIFFISILTRLPNFNHHNQFTADEVTQAFIAYGEDHTDMPNLTASEVKEARDYVKVDVLESLEYWVAQGVFYKLTKLNGVRYQLSEEGRGFIKGVDLGNKNGGKLDYKVVKELTDEEIEALNDTPPSGKVCDECGEIHDDKEHSIVDILSRLFGK